jgi:hypothetical protein
MSLFRNQRVCGGFTLSVMLFATIACCCAQMAQASNNNNSHAQHACCDPTQTPAPASHQENPSDHECPFTQLWQNGFANNAIKFDIPPLDLVGFPPINLVDLPSVACAFRTSESDESLPPMTLQSLRICLQC